MLVRYKEEVSCSPNRDRARRVEAAYSSRHLLKKQWLILPEQDAEFVWRMEDVLEVYTGP